MPVMPQPKTHLAAATTSPAPTAVMNRSERVRGNEGLGRNLPVRRRRRRGGSRAPGRALPQPRSKGFGSEELDHAGVSERVGLHPREVQELGYTFVMGAEQF